MLAAGCPDLAFCRAIRRHTGSAQWVLSSASLAEDKKTKRGGAPSRTRELAGSHGRSEDSGVVRIALTNRPAALTIHRIFACFEALGPEPRWRPACKRSLIIQDWCFVHEVCVVL